MNGRERKRTFLIEMHELEDHLFDIHQKLHIPDETLATIMIQKMIQFEGELGDSFYEMIIGNYFTDLFLELVKEETARLEVELQKMEKEQWGFLLKGIVQTLLNRGELLNYMYICGVVKNSTISFFEDDIVEFIELYVHSQTVTEEEDCLILNRIRMELASCVSYEFAKSVMEKYSFRLYSEKQKILEKSN